VNSRPRWQFPRTMSPAPDWPESPPDGRLPRGETHVWRVWLGRESPELAALLSEEESQRAARFHFSEGRRQFSVTRGALRLLLGAYLGIAPRDVRLKINGHGKPSLEGEGTLRFNAAHSHEFALIAFSLDGKAGVDIEHTQRRLRLEEMSRIVLSEKERADWFELPEAAQRQEFFRHWTAKEAYLKALGVGLSRELREIVTASLPVQLLDCGLDYAAALAVLPDGPGKIIQRMLSNRPQSQP
jgi:4'-phosphopantetheinyl transferase